MTKKTRPVPVDEDETQQGWVEYDNLVRSKTFTDDAGVTWRRRGGDILSGRDLSKVLLDPAVTVLHEYLDERTVIAPEERSSFWRKAELAMRESKFSDFYGGEFKNGRQRLLVVHEDC